jgi:hypothetical protein
MGRDGGNEHKKLEVKRLLCASQFTIADTAGTTYDPGGKNTDTTFYKYELGKSYPDYSYLLVSSIPFQPSYHISLSLLSSPNAKLSHLSLSPHFMIMSQYIVQHTPSNAYTEYSIR